MIEQVKLFLGITDEIQDKLLQLIVEDSNDRIIAVINMFAKLNETEPVKDIPEELKFVHRDVSIKRFNKINSEGASSDSEEGRSISWEASYLSEYEDLLDQYTKPKKVAGKGTARFLE
ncbi:phage head-tail connector protein [Candidatus Enterococcus clewellii]|uniref:Phage head-tail connector protein n=1 Tax=Candidatus Enterococcus clewellii TaxID=1834193 RepID=A0A242K4X9_9ENTE|nr:phage head-tail connector protein [Enterococcus sp. 9E7_DIV0242]OTP13434.1 hypothetical protein A5888_002912 [Enterococcus sp. 9E7_DIV0242]